MSSLAALGSPWFDDQSSSPPSSPYLSTPKFLPSPLPAEKDVKTAPSMELHRQVHQLTQAFQATESVAAARALATLLHDSADRGKIPTNPTIQKAIREAALSGLAEAFCLRQAGGALDVKNNGQPDAPQKSTVCYCDLIKKAEECIRSGEVSLALDNLRRAADANISHAYTLMGSLFLGDSASLNRDASHAAMCFQAGVEAGDPSAMTWLARLHLLGDGVQRDDDRAKALVLDAAAQHFPEADVLLGLMHVFGRGVSRDRILAEQHYRWAANKDDLGGRLGIHLLSLDHAGYHPSFDYCISLFQEASFGDGSGWLCSIAMDAWYGWQGSKPDLETAVERFRQAGELGDQLALCCLGYMKEHGLGTKQKYDDAHVLYKEAIKKGSTQATCLLAEVYLSGRGVKKDRGRAKELFAEAAEMGAPAGKAKTGMMYLEAGQDESPAEAIKYFENCLEEGYELGSVCLGEMYAKGLSVPKDLDMAATHFEKAAKAGHPEGMSALGMLYRNRHSGIVDKDKSVDLLLRAVEGKSTTAMIILGSMHESGMYVEQDCSRAYELYKRAAQQGNPNGDLALANLYVESEDTWGTKKDAERHFLKAFEFGGDRQRCEALFGLGRLHDAGVVSNPSFQIAFDLYQRCARFGPCSTALKAVTRMGVMLEKGLVGPRNIEEATKLYKEAADAGNSDGLFRLGVIFERGRGVPADTKRAYKLYCRASESGSVAATVKLGRFSEMGSGVEKNERLAASFYQAAAVYGNREGQFHYGRVLLRGIGVGADAEEGLKWVRMAADQGLTRARGLLSFFGEEIKSISSG